jgi:hypothetical protein
MVDHNMKVKLLEVNENPSLKFDRPEIDNLIKSVVLEAIEMNVYNKSPKQFVKI